MRALVSDPQAARRLALRAELERHDHAVEVVDPTPEALERAIRSGECPVVVAIGAGPAAGVDGLDGVEIIERLRGLDLLDRTAIVLVGSAGEIDAARALSAGATDLWVLDDTHEPGVDIRLALARHYARLQAEHVRIGGEFALLRRALDLTGTGFVLTDPRLPDDPIVYVNRAFCDLTGYDPDAILGRNCRFLQGPETDPRHVDEIRAALAADRPLTVELVNHRRDGAPFHIELHIAPVRDARGLVVRRVGVQLDVTAYRDQEQLFARELEARRTAEAAQRRSAFLAAAGPLLDASLDLRETLDAFARIAIPYLADACLVDVLEGDEVVRVAAAAKDPIVEAAIRDLPARILMDGEGAEAVGEVVRSGRAAVLPVTPAAFGELLAGSGIAMVVPLRARGRVLGAVSFATLDPGHAYGPPDLALAEDLARRAALALDNARLYGQQETVARLLQESLLPTALPEVDGLELAGRFRPAGDGTEVGGDFYDVFRGDGGSVVLTIGDVTGKGAAAAALTAAARHTLRAAARYESSPAAILTTLNDVLLESRGSGGRFCTAAISCVRPGEHGATVMVACGGHPPLLVLRASGAVDPVAARGTVLGYTHDAEFVEDHVELGPGDAIVMYTDGLSEARSQDGRDSGVELADLLAGCVGGTADEIADRLQAAVLALGNGTTRDDLAIAVARVQPSPVTH